MDFLALAQQLGITAACLVALGWTVWRSLTWFALNVVKPMADRHIKFVDELALAASAQAEAMRVQSEAMRLLADHSEKVSLKHDVLMEKHDKLMDLTADLMARQEALMVALAEIKTHVEKMEIKANSVVVLPKGT